MNRSRRALVSLVPLMLVCAAGVTAQRPLVDTAQTQTSVVIRQDLIENLPGRSVLLAFDPSKLPQPGVQFADQAHVDFPETFRGTTDLLPGGWTARMNGKTFIASGAATDAVAIRIRSADWREIDKMVGKQCRIRLSLGGKEFLDRRITFGAVEPMPPLHIGTLPSVVMSGRSVWGSIQKGIPKDITPQLIIGSSAPVPLPSTEYGVLDGTRFTLTPAFVGRFKISETESPRPADFKLVWFDDWRYPLAEINTRMLVTPERTCTAGITGGDRLAFAGQNVCVTGCLSEDAKAIAGVLDGGRELTAMGGAVGSWMFQVPADAKPGAYTIDLGSAGKHQVGVLAVEGSIDQNELWKGQSTTMRLRVVGSEERLPLRIVNKTPATITVDGGVSQLVDSAGGSDNALTRSVRGIMKGNFNIEYSLNLPACGIVPPPK